MIEHLEVDSDVGVFVVGDIHGEYTQLIGKLKDIGFNFESDLLIAVGDLVDRGSENEKCINLLNEKWFKSIRGNHEQFCIDGFQDSSIAFYHRMKNNGGAWFYNHQEDIQSAIVNKLNKLPVLLEIKYKNKKYGFIHADVPVQDWDLLKEMLMNGDILNERPIVDHCLWSRNIVNLDHVDIYGIDNVFLGHTVLENIKQVGNCTFLDTGGCFSSVDEKYRLSIIKI